MVSKYNNRYYQKLSVIEGHHVYKAIWTPTIGEKESVQSKDDTEHAVAMIKHDQMCSVTIISSFSPLTLSVLLSSLSIHTFIRAKVY